MARRWRFLLVGAVLLLGLQLPTPTPAAGAAAADVTLTLTASAGGSASANPPGPSLPAGSIVTLSATPAPGQVFIGWTIDGAQGGWVNPRKLVMDTNHAVVATFAPSVTFSDVSPGAAEATAIRQISARGIIKGYTAAGCAARGVALPCFGPADSVLRAEIAVMIVRALHWEGIPPADPGFFSDLGGIDPELQRAIRILAAQGVMKGYTDGRAGPIDPVLRIQVIALIARAMVKAGYWTAETVNNPAPYPNVPLASGLRLDLLTFVKNAGPIPDRPQDQPWADWLAPAPRAWTARLLWQALNAYFTGPPFNPSPTNAPPVGVGDAYTTNVDTPLTVVAPGVLANDTDPNGDALTAVLVSDPIHGTLTLNPDGSFTYTPDAGYSGSDSFTYRASDGSASSNIATVTIAIGAVNQPPSFTKGPDQTVAEDAGPQSVAGWATAISAGPGEVGQTVTFQVTNDNNALFVAQPAVSPTGTLTYTPAANASGSVTVTVVLKDNGGTANGGSDTSAPQTFTITVNAVNDAPVNTVPGAQTTFANAPVVFSAGNGNAISVADVDAGGNPVQATLTATNGTLTLATTAGLTFSAGDGTADATMTFTGTLAAINTALNGLAFTPTSGYAGAATVTITTDDQGNTGAGGVLSDTDTIAITVTALPAVASTTPSNAATNVATNANLSITFNQAVTVVSGWFTISCASSGAHTAVESGGPTTYSLDPAVDFSQGEACTVIIVAAQVTAQGGGAHPAANFAFSFTTDVAPAVTTTVPANGATGVLPSATITVNFSESVNATTASFTIACPGGTPVAFTLSASPAASYTLTPTAPLPAGTICTVTALAAGITDADGGDPPDNMAADFVFSFSVPPVATSDSYAPTIIGNVGVNTALGSGFSILTNDLGSGLTINQSGTSVPTAQGGTVVVAASGTFTYNPPTGYEGADSFTYTVTNAAGTSAPATVTLQTIGGVIWFVNNNAGACSANCDGRLSNPFTSLGAFAAVNDGVGSHPAANDRIFVYESATAYTGPITLLAGQRLIGQDATASLATLAGLTPSTDTIALPAMASGNGVFTQIVNGAGNGVALGSGNYLYGFRLGAVSGIAIGGIGFGTLTVGDVLINTTGQALSLTTGTLTGGFTGISSTGGANNVLLTAVQTSGTVSLGAGALSGATGDAFKVDGGGGAFSYAGTITNAATLAVNIANKTGGSVTLSGDINPAGANRGITASGNGGGTTITFSGANQKISTGTTAGVNLTNNTGATIEFTGGALAIATTTGSGFSATGGGTVRVTGAANTIASVGGVALTVANTTIGTGGLTFQSIAANGGANGIVLNTTGATAGLTVTGNSGGNCGGQANTSGAPIAPVPGDCTGGTIQNIVGADGATAGNGVYLNATRGVSLTRMHIHDVQNFAIRGAGVTDLTLQSVLVDGTNGTNANPVSGTEGDEEGGVSFTGLTGTASVTNSSFSGGIARNFQIVNASGTLNRVTFTNNQFGLDSTALGSDSLFIQADNDPNRALAVVLNATIQDNRFTGSRGDLFQLSVRGTGQSDLVFTGNRLSNNHPNIVSGGGGMTIGTGGTNISPTLTYNISNNTFRDALGPALSIGKGGVGAGTFTGRVDNNTFGVSGVANSGSAQGSAIAADIIGAGSHTIAITNNQIYQFTNYGILLQAGNTGTGGGQGYLTATITGNTITQPSPASAAAAFPTSGIRIVLGVTSGPPSDNPKACITVGGTAAAQTNTLTGTGTNGGDDLRLFQRFLSILGVPGYAGANNDNAAMNAFLAARNTATTINATNNTGAGGPGYSGTCP